MVQKGQLGRVVNDETDDKSSSVSRRSSAWLPAPISGIGDSCYSDVVDEILRTPR